MNFKESQSLGFRPNFSYYTKSEYEAFLVRNIEVRKTQKTEWVKEFGSTIPQKSDICNYILTSKENG
jgi:uncharacterized membrane protein